MNILVIGDQINLQELRQKFGDKHEYSWVNEHRDAEKYLLSNEVVFDFIIDEEPHQFEIYFDHPATVFINTCKISLGELVHLAGQQASSRIFGFNGMPTLFNREVLEVSVHRAEDLTLLHNLCDQLKTAYQVVEDRVGLVTPRIVCMIINEAYYAAQEGTATRTDIDLAMKLGTNYPYGPFEWAQRIGIRHVYELIEALYDDTRDERYKICPLLKNEYLNISS
ncbi:3-hydroxyacyl-CoA dehydrogenase family protein [Chryseolinea sp. T2]|uniref:3-hydroxyacyl-CoA dehydrogenase family protein n=1 Tax=Chryseolinea sp. T2 TaxID=3129255 RepID=UPI00307829B9